MDSPLPENLTEEMDKFLQLNKDIPDGEDYYQEVFDNNTIFPLQRQTELALMMKKTRSILPETVFEVGTDKGGGLYHWCKCLPSVKRVIACEIRGTPFSEVFERAFPHIEFLWLPCSSYSQTTVDAVKKWLNGTPIDCLFIDGDKSGFKKDFYAYRDMMISGGFVFLHDITDTAPGRAFQQLKEKTRLESEEIIDRSDSMQAIKEYESGIRKDTAHRQWLRHWKGESCGVGVLHV